MTTTTLRPRAAGAPAKLPRWRRRDRAWGWLFVGPQMIGMVGFVLLPFAAGLALAFASWDGLGPISFVGLQNFRTELTNSVFLAAIWHTLLIALITVPIGLGAAVVIATALNNLHLRTVYMVMFFLPVVTSSVAAAMIWQQLLRPDGYLSTGIAHVFHIAPPDWLNNNHLVLLSICFVAIWSSLGLNVLIFLAGLQNINPAILEAARIDGAGVWTSFIRIRLPLLSPTIFFSTVVAVISSFQTFDTVYVLTRNAGPDSGGRTIVYDIYDTAFMHHDFGSASAGAVILLVLTLLVTLAQFSLQKRFVHYES